MLRLRANLAALALVVCQLLIAAAGLWHHHEPVDAARGAMCAGSEKGHDHGPRPDDHPAPVDDHDDCLICQIVASQRIDTIDRAGVPLLLPVCVALRTPPAPTHSSREHIPPRSRAPPSFSRA